MTDHGPRPACEGLEPAQADRIFFVGGKEPGQVANPRALEFCARCPEQVRIACGRLALEAEGNDDVLYRFGVFGGTAPVQRADYVRKGLLRQSPA